MAIPVSLVGTFAILMALGYNANTITLFALIMAIGLVVDDAIVVVENVHRVMHEENLSAPAATKKAMSQVTGPVISTTLVLFSVFVPVGFMPGITGELYRQFAVTMCSAVLLSAICALTLSPALCATFLTRHRVAGRGPYAWFNRLVDASRKGYVKGSGWMIRWLIVPVLLLTAVITGMVFLFIHTPTSFLPREDQGYFFVNVQLPQSASLSRTAAVMDRINKEIRELDGVASMIGVSGFSLLSGNAPNVGFSLPILKPWDERREPHQQLDAIVKQAQAKLAAIPDANAFAFAPPPISGLGASSGFTFQLLAKEGQGPQELFGMALGLMMTANQDPVLDGVFTTYTADTPQIFVDVDRTRAQYLEVPVSRLFSTLQAHLGSSYVNDFNLGGRTYQVKVQADDLFRDTMEDIQRLYVRSDDHKMIPLTSLVALRTVLGPQLIKRYNQFASADFNGNAATGFSSGQAMDAMEKVAAGVLAPGFDYEWSALSFQEKNTGNEVVWLFALALVFAYLFLVAQYESWNLPLSIVLTIPVGSLGAGRAMAAGHAVVHLCPDRTGAAGGSGCQKRHPHCGVRQKPAPGGVVHRRGCRDRRGHPFPPRTHDFFDFYLRPGAHAHCNRGRGRQPEGHRHSGFFRHVRGHLFRDFSDSGPVLYFPDHQRKGPGEAGEKQRPKRWLRSRHRGLSGTGQSRRRVMPGGIRKRQRPGAQKT